MQNSLRAEASLRYVSTLKVMSYFKKKASDFRKLCKLCMCVYVWVCVLVTHQESPTVLPSAHVKTKAGRGGGAAGAMLGHSVAC